MKAAGNTQTICDINSYKYTRTHTRTYIHTCVFLSGLNVFVSVSLAVTTASAISVAVFHRGGIC